MSPKPQTIECWHTSDVGRSYRCWYPQSGDSAIRILYRWTAFFKADGKTQPQSTIRWSFQWIYIRYDSNSASWNSVEATASSVESWLWKTSSVECLYPSRDAFVSREKEWEIDSMPISWKNILSKWRSETYAWIWGCREFPFSFWQSTFTQSRGMVWVWIYITWFDDEIGNHSQTNWAKNGLVVEWFETRTRCLKRSSMGYRCELDSLCWQLSRGFSHPICSSRTQRCFSKQWIFNRVLREYSITSWNGQWRRCLFWDPWRLCRCWETYCSLLLVDLSEHDDEHLSMGRFYEHHPSKKCEQDDGFVQELCSKSWTPKQRSGCSSR